jgi:hypothetical protein
MLYGANNQPIESTLDDDKKVEQDFANIPSENFPPPTPKPDWFDAQVNKIGGYFDPGTNKLPKYRVVWGMDPEVKQFAMGEFHMKYVSIVDTYETLKGYNIITPRKGKDKEPERQFLPPREAHKRYLDPKTGQMTRNIRRGQLIAPVIVTEKKEIGQPWWVVEQYVPPEAFGDIVEWNNQRYMVNPTDPMDFIDVLGEYPDQGAYIHWFDILDYDEEGHPKYHELDDGALEMIRANHVANIARRNRLQFTTPEEARKQKDAAFDEEWAKYDREITLEMLDIKKNKHSVS